MMMNHLMTNAKDEFLNHIIMSKKSKHIILCASLKYYGSYPCNDSVINLTTGWTDEDWDSFLTKLNISYYSGYGGQELFGTIWYTDGTWSLRVQYDGSEWWEYYRCPDIPKEINRIDKVRDKKINVIINDR